MTTAPDLFTRAVLPLAVMNRSSDATEWLNKISKAAADGSLWEGPAFAEQLADLKVVPEG
jgi:hypothetical protein